MIANGTSRLAIGMLSLVVGLCAIAMTESSNLGAFESQSDVGKIDRPGSADFDVAKHEYRITGSGANIWGNQDAFHFVWRKLSGDVTITSDIRFDGRGGDAHRKACLMVRQSLEPGAPYADVAEHGDGLISLQFRRTPGGITEEVKSTIKAPARVQLARQGDRFTLQVMREGKPDESVGPVQVSLHDPVYAGLAVSSHNAAVSETAVFWSLELK